MRASNTGFVLFTIWQQSPISRVRLTEVCGLSRATVSDIVTELISAGLVAEIGSGTSTGGRKPILLQLVEDARALVGIGMAYDHIEAVVMSLRGRVLASVQIKADLRGDPQTAIEKATAACREVIAEAAIPAVLGVGIGISSPLFGEDARKVIPVVLPAWGDLDLIADFEARLGLPVFLDNDANLGALAEYWWGSCQGVDHFTYVEAGVGVGAAHVLDGRVYRGGTGLAGELGHIKVSEDGPECNCGRRGCLESLIGIDHLEQRFGADFETLVSAARSGQPKAVDTLEAAGAHLGNVLGHVVSMLNPSRVVLSGPLLRAGNLVADAVRARIKEVAFSLSADTEVLESEFQGLTVAIGAATRVLERALLGGSGAAGNSLSTDVGGEGWFREGSSPTGPPPSQGLRAVGS